MKAGRLTLLSLLLALLLIFAGCEAPYTPTQTTLSSTTAATTTAPVTTTATTPPSAESPDGIPTYAGYPYVEIAGNVPTFTDEEIAEAVNSYEFFSELDTLGRCGYVEASVGIDLMPTEERGSIGMVKPSGWQTAKYDIVSGKYLYNRCHLIGFQLTGENANEKNLITGTRYLNIDGMLPFENMIAAYVKDTENHVIFRVTPVYVGNELVARGLLMEAYSIEDEGDGISFYVYVYNVQPGITINYADGTSYLSTEPPVTTEKPPVTVAPTEQIKTYIVNNSSDKFHLESCRYADSIAEHNRDEITAKRSDLIEAGYDPCGTCKP